MAVFRIEKTRDYTVMSNHHLRDMSLSLKAKGFYLSCCPCRRTGLLFELFPHYNTLCRFVQYTFSSLPLLLQICNQ